MGNICCSQKEDSNWLTEQLEQDAMPNNRQPIGRMAVLEESDLSEEEEDLPFERILSKRRGSESVMSSYSSEDICLIAEVEDAESHSEISQGEELLQQPLITCETDHDEEEVQTAMTVLQPQESPFSIEEVISQASIEKKATPSPSVTEQVSPAKSGAAAKPPIGFSLSQSQRIMSRSATKTAAQDTMTIQEGVEEDLCLSESNDGSSASMGSGSQGLKTRFEKNLNELARSGRSSGSASMTKSRKSIGSTANSYVWIKERRHTTFTGLTFEQRQRGLNRRSMTMIEKDSPDSLTQ